MIKFKSILQLELFTKAEQQLECKNDVLQESILSAYDNGYLSDEFHHFHFDVLTIDEYVGEGASIGSKLYDIDLLDDNSRGWWEGTLPSLFFGTREELNSFLDQHINKNHKLQDEYLKNVKEGVINLIESSKAGKANKGILKDDTQIKVAKLFLQTEPKTTIATLEPLLKKYLSVQSSTNIKAREFDAAYGNNLRAAYKIMAQANINLGNLDNAEKNYIKFLDTRGISGEVTKENLEVDRALIDIYKRSNNHLKIIKIRQKIKSHYVHEAKKGTQNNSAYEEITENLGSLSWNYLLTKQYDKAYESAAEALKTDPSKIWVKTNLAHALLLSGKKERAETIYLVNANQILNQDRSFGTAVIDDFKRLKEHGISHPYMKSIEEKINNLITP